MIADYRNAYQYWLRTSQPLVRFASHRDVQQLHAWVMALIGLRPIYYLEFGVLKGRSLRWWLRGNRHPDSRFVGFDSFQGIPEDWEGSDGLHPAGSFTGVQPVLKDDRARCIPGWFADTVPGFMLAHDCTRLLVLHLDCDCYSSAKTVLERFASQLRSGDILILDEAGTGDEFKALLEAPITIAPLAFAGCAVAVQVQ